MAAAKKVGIGFGHTDFQELLPLAKLAKEIGVRATLDHPLLELNKLLLDEMKQLRDLGVYVGTYCQPMIPSLYQPVADPMETIRTIKEIGPDRCIIGSDFGQVLHMDAIDGMRVFIRALLGFGIKPNEVKVMLQDNPAKLMWLEEKEAATVGPQAIAGYRPQETQAEGTETLKVELTNARLELNVQSQKTRP